MSLFNLGKKKEEQCSCTADANEGITCAYQAGQEILSIKVLGSGCASCHKLYENTKEAVGNLGMAVQVEYVTDMERIMEYGVMSMPALVINDTVASMGKVLKTAEIEKLLK